MANKGPTSNNIHSNIHSINNSNNNNNNLVYLSSRQQANRLEISQPTRGQKMDDVRSSVDQRERGNKLIAASPTGGHHRHHHHNQSNSPSSSSLQSITTSDSELSIELTAATTTTTNNNNNNNAFQDDKREILINNTNGNISVNSKQLQTHDKTTMTGNNNNNNNSNELANGGQSRSPPILIKYNYYDYNGDRQEQINQDMNFHNQNGGNINNNGNNNNKITRQLSPTFKQNLDQIVRNSQQYLLTSNGNNNNSYHSPNDSPRQMSPTNNNQFNTMMLARRYKLSSYEQRCVRCRKTVYQMDKVGPLKDFTFYHQNCFKCLECGTKLTLKTYFNNQHSSVDQEVYCHRHCPKTPAGRLDNQSVGIRAALNAPKVFDVHQVLGQWAAAANGSNGAGGPPGGFVLPENFNNNYHNVLNMGSVNQLITNGNNMAAAAAAAAALANQNGQPIFSAPNRQHVASGEQNAPPNVDSNALYIQHAVHQTKLQAIYKQSQVDKKISQFLNKRLEYLEPKQKMLEMRHRAEEEQLFKQFEQKWRQEESSISEQIRQEWQLELEKLIEKYKQQLSNIHLDTSSANLNQLAKNKSNQTSQKQQQLELMEDLRRRVEATENKLKASNAAHLNGHNNYHQPEQQQQQPARGQIEEQSGQQMIELERMNLEKTMTIKLDRKKMTLKRKLKEFERQATAELVERQSREMLALISMKLEEFKEEQKRKIGSELEQFEAIESLANQLGASLQVNALDGFSKQQQQHQHHYHKSRSAGNGKTPLAAAAAAAGAVSELPPPPRAPKTSKMELYNSEQPDEVFKEIDQLAINVAREDQQTFTDLVHHLTRNCLTDVEKVRAIFRWITVKNLNTMQFDDPSIKPDTPLGLLRGIKQGSESYHVLFKRLCSYAGLHCVVIKGYSKSAGYQPGVPFEGNRFRNSWNAVYVAGAWRFVQCNWGARHLVSVAVMQDNKNNNINSSNSNSNGSTTSGDRGNIVMSPTGPVKGGAVVGRSQQPVDGRPSMQLSPVPNLGRRGAANHHHHHHQLLLAEQQTVNNNSGGKTRHLDARHANGTVSPEQHHLMMMRSAVNSGLSPSSPAHSSASSSSNISSLSLSSSAASSPCCPSPSPATAQHHHHHHRPHHSSKQNKTLTTAASDSLRYEYDDHYFLTDPDEFIYEFYPLAPEWQLLSSRPLSLQEFEQLPFVRSLFFKYGLYFPQPDIKSVLVTDSSGATTIKIGMPTHMVPSLIFHCNLKYFHSDQEHHNGVSLKRFVMQSVESGASHSGGDMNGGGGGGGQVLMSNIVSFRVHLPENGAYILDIFANSTTPSQYITGEPMKFKSVCKFKIVAKNLKTVMIPLPDCASGEYGPMKATRLFGLIPITHENGLITVHHQNDNKRFLEIQFRMTRPLLDFMASLHKNNYDERQLSKSIKIFVDGDIVFITIKFQEDGQYGLDIYTRDQAQQQMLEQAPTTDNNNHHNHHHHHHHGSQTSEPKKQLLTHCCKYLINVRSAR